MEKSFVHGGVTLPSHFTKINSVDTEIIELAKPIQILVIDSHPMNRYGIRAMLASRSSAYFFRIFEAEDAFDAVKKLQDRPFDLVLLDYMLPQISAPEVAKKIFMIQPDVRLLTMADSPELPLIMKMKNLGACGCIQKNIQVSELYSAMHDVLNGRIYYSATIANKLLQQNTSYKNISSNLSLKLSPRELSILKLIELGRTNREISGELYIGERTVETHRKNLMCKLQVRNAAALIRAGYEYRLIP